MFDNTIFAEADCFVPSGSRLLVFSDGAFELPLPDGRLGTLDEFLGLVERLLPSADFSLDALVEQLRSRTAEGFFDDDCSLVLAKFDA